MVYSGVTATAHGSYCDHRTFQHQVDQHQTSQQLSNYVTEMMNSSSLRPSSRHYSIALWEGLWSCACYEWNGDRGAVLMTAVQLVALGTKEPGIAPQGFSATPSCQVLSAYSIMLPHDNLHSINHSHNQLLLWLEVLAIVTWLELGSTCWDLGVMTASSYNLDCQDWWLRLKVLFLTAAITHAEN